MNKNETSNKTFELEEMHPLNECGNSEVSNRRSNFPHPLFEDTSSISNDFETICAPGNSNSINTPVLTLPKFWETSPTAWFTVAESVFSLKRIVSEHIKFHAVVNALEARHIKKIKHVLVTANWAKPYSILKQALTKSFEASDDFKLNKLLSLPALDPVSTQKRPTELLLEMQALLGQTTPLGTVAESLLRKLFIDKLPPQVRLILAALPELSLEELANKAESSMQVATPSLGQGSRLASQPLSAAEPSPQNLTQMLINQNFDGKISKLTESINKLQDLSKATSTTVQEQVPPSNPTYRTPPTSLQSNFRRNPWNYSQRPRQDYRPPKFRNQQFHGNRFNTFNQYDHRNGESLCFYHSTFGDRAHKCTPPCSKANQKNAGSSSRQ